MRVVLRSGAARHRAPSSARHPPKQPSRGARMRKSVIPERLDASAQLKLKVSSASRLQVTSATREITPVPRRSLRCQRDWQKPRSTAVNCTHAGLMRRTRSVDNSFAITATRGLHSNSTPQASMRVARIRTNPPCSAAGWTLFRPRSGPSASRRIVEPAYPRSSRELRHRFAS